MPCSLECTDLYGDDRCWRGRIFTLKVVLLYHIYICSSALQDKYFLVPQNLLTVLSVMQVYLWKFKLYFPDSTDTVMSLHGMKYIATNCPNTLICTVIEIVLCGFKRYNNRYLTQTQSKKKWQNLEIIINLTLLVS